MDPTRAAGPGSASRGDGHRLSAACVVPAITASVPALRRLALRCARRWQLPEEIDEALGLVVTELVTNAVRHSGGPQVTLRLCVADGALTVQVEDSGRWRPRTTPPGNDGSPDGAACGGRGLPLVEAYAAGFTVLTSVRGTTVTAELLLPVPAAPVPPPAPPPAPVRPRLMAAPV